MTKFKLTNKTKWSTRDLKKLCNAVIRKVGSHKKHSIKVQTTKSWRYEYMGYAWINHYLIVMKVPKITKTKFMKGNDGKTLKVEEPIIFNSVTFAQVLTHEIHHNLGLSEHKDMVSTSEIDCEYAKEFTVNAQIPKQKPQIDHIRLRFDRAKANLQKAETRLKRAKTLHKKWMQKVKYYQKKYGDDANG